MANTYIIVPTADDYSTSLGAAATVCGLVVGAMAVAQIFSSVYLSAWSNKSYSRPLLFSSIVLLVGNVMYALAYDLKSLPILLTGRLLCGYISLYLSLSLCVCVYVCGYGLSSSPVFSRTCSFGSARAVNRRYISDYAPEDIRVKASAGFVSASALGMACGPALAGLLQTNFKVYGVTFNQVTLPGWVMSVAWLVYIIWLHISFREPAHRTQVNHFPQEPSAGNNLLISLLFFLLSYLLL